MSILHIGASIVQNAQQKLTSTAEKLVREPFDPSHVIDAKLAVNEGKVGAKLIQRGQEFQDALLDVLA